MSKQHGSSDNQSPAVKEASAAYRLRIDKETWQDDSIRRVDKQSASTYDRNARRKPMSKQHGSSDNQSPAVKEASAAYRLRIDKETWQDDSNRRVDKQSASTASLQPSVDAHSLIHPTTWHSVPLGKVVTFQRGYDLPHRVRKQGTIPIVSSAGVTDYHNLPMVNPPGVVTGRYGTIGEIFFVTEPFWPLNTTLYVRDFHGNDPCFVYYLLHRFDFLSFSGKSGVPGVNRNDLHLEPVALPDDINEQRAIAAALSDMDALLDGLNRLIAKKRDLKQATMQQLLTGQTRLPGFGASVGAGLKPAPTTTTPTDWTVVRLGEVADVKTGPFGSSLHESDYVQEGTPIITVEHLGEFGVEHFNLPRVSDADRRRLQAYELAVGDIVFSRVGSVDRNALIRSTEKGWLFSGRLLRVRCDQRQVHPPFLSFQFHSEPFKALVRSVAVGQTMASLNTQILNGIYISLPPFLEQTAIATILSDMDAELAALEARRDKTRALKLGMMQELLTGKTRLL